MIVYIYAHLYCTRCHNGSSSEHRNNYDQICDVLKLDGSRVEHIVTTLGIVYIAAQDKKTDKH